MRKKVKYYHSQSQKPTGNFATSWINVIAPRINQGEVKIRTPQLETPKPQDILIDCFAGYILIWPTEILLAATNSFLKTSKSRVVALDGHFFHP
ncbi:hypothetical protein DAPPUDRAFT_316748 [Daphnia pulex]|uniref:Uncharacterized protein n=1 Tax=Daphnia pulex TaxID=6669 RepID=E9GDV6_DAPPU|nr:hypothetical protein DAPPUDRAFT_316748 [Daphnia pulex]|eukprot:EFX82149.1 hypothetical protein DAPPUDRAFT_316748 [Daphnia pulex]